MTFEVRHVPEHQRFEVPLDGDLAVLDYTRTPDALVLVHTGVPPQFQHQGIAAQLAHSALEYARSAGLHVVPRCTYVRAYLSTHPEYASLVR